VTHVLPHVIDEGIDNTINGLIRVSSKQAHGEFSAKFRPAVPPESTLSGSGPLNPGLGISLYGQYFFFKNILIGHFFGRVFSVSGRQFHIMSQDKFGAPAFVDFREGRICCKRANACLL